MKIVWLLLKIFLSDSLGYLIRLAVGLDGVACTGIPGTPGEPSLLVRQVSRPVRQVSLQVRQASLQVRQVCYINRQVSLLVRQVSLRQSDM
jgi:hypothetical protein